MRHAALTARAEAFPLGFGILTRRGLLAWRNAVTRATAAARPAPRHPSTAAATVSTTAAVTAELIDALAGLALTGT
ncbi:hypothetical protein [Nocardia sp. NPDC020380]|uniref:hypothetical protein n=1 Tax=Nocardia sp. NPDC020380 TaxID=3364309 RepID=UPI0037BBD3B8